MPLWSRIFWNSAAAFFALSSRQICLSANVHVIEAGDIVDERHLSQFDGRSSLQSVQGGSRISSIQCQLCLNRGQPKRLHLRVQREAFVQVLRQRFGSRRIARHGKRKRGFAPRHLDLLEQASKPLRCFLAFAFRRIAERGFSLSGIRLPDSPSFLAVGADGGIHGLLGQFPRLAQVTGIGFGIGGERKPDVLVIGLARKPLLLFRHRWQNLCRRKARA